MDKYFMWIHYERLRNHNKAKHNKTVCIFLGIYCICTKFTTYRKSIRLGNRNIVLVTKKTHGLKSALYNYFKTKSASFQVSSCTLVNLNELWFLYGNIFLCSGLMQHIITIFLFNVNVIRFELAFVYTQMQNQWYTLPFCIFCITVQLINVPMLMQSCKYKLIIWINTYQMEMPYGPGVNCIYILK